MRCYPQQRPEACYFSLSLCCDGWAGGEADPHSPAWGWAFPGRLQVAQLPALGDWQLASWKPGSRPCGSPAHLCTLTSPGSSDTSPDPKQGCFKL